MRPRIRSTHLYAVFAAVLVAHIAQAALGAERFDMLIKNGSVLDGTGTLAIRADVGVRRGRIRFVGDGSRMQAERVIDAQGLIVAPGFIDAHSHADNVLARAKNNEERVSLANISQGVTTVLLGPDGGYEPAKIESRIKAFESAGVGVNFAFYIGHNGIRSAVMADPHAKASAEELDAMRAMVRRGMEMGTVGLTTGLMYDPGMYADMDEVVALAREVAPFGGSYDSHVRDPVFRLIESDEEALEVGRRAGIPVKIAHEKAPALRNKGRAKDIVALINRERSQGRNAVVDQYPYDGAGTMMLQDIFLIPQQGGPSSRPASIDSLRSALRDSGQRAAVQEGMEQGPPDGGFSWLKSVGYGGLRIVDSPQEPALVDENIELLAKKRGVSGFDVLTDLVTRHDDIRLTLATIDEGDIRLIMMQPWTMIATDGGGIDSARSSKVCIHPRTMGTFPRVLGRYARELGVLSLPEAVRKMTSFPADFLQLHDRGRIAVDKVADITIFNPENVIDRATYAQPCELSTGIEYVLVNGVAVFEHGRATGALPGRFVPRQSMRRAEP